jgi:hypothetical protein
VAQTVYYLQNEIWDDMLVADYHAQFSCFPVRTEQLKRYLTHAQIRSLAANGLLGSDMFAYPQATFSPEPLLLRNSLLEHGFPLWAGAADIYMELGLVNYAEKTIGELMECMGPYPFPVYRRTLLHLAKGNGATASVYLKKLSAMPFYRNEARHLLAILEDSTAVAAHPRIAHLRSCMDTTDYFFLSCSEEELLLHLLRRNPHNKTAYEYLMGLYLLTGRVDKLVERLPDAAAFGYTILPRHWQEAICVRLSLLENPVDTAAIGSDLALVSPQTFYQFDRFM